MHVRQTVILLETAAHVRPQFYLKQMEYNFLTQTLSGLYTQRCNMLQHDTLGPPQ